MKKLAVTFLISIFTFSAIIFAGDKFPNDTQTRLLIKGDNCGVIDVIDAYFTRFGSNGGDGKALVLKLKIKNYAFAKLITAQNGNDLDEAFNTQFWWQYPVSVDYTGQADGDDYATLVDQRVGPDNYIKIHLTVSMGGEKYYCSNVEVGQ